MEALREIFEKSMYQPQSFVMKKQSLFLALTVVSAMSIVSCSKKGSGDNPLSAASKIIYGRVIEEGTDLPLAGAEFITSTCAKNDIVFGCVQWDETSTFTGSDGKLRWGNSRNYLLHKQGYWNYVNRPDYPSYSIVVGYTKYQPAHVIYYSSAGQTDSLLIKLFPITNISVRVRNTGVPTAAILKCSANVFATQGNNIILRAGIDSSFQYPVFGNSENKIFIYRDSLSDSASMQTRFIAKNEILNLDISY
jgi:hypothetical protein